jgi:hypothetical protein
MAIAVTFSPTMTLKQYEESIERLKGAGPWPAPGMQYHVCFGDPENLQVGEVWESEEAFRSFGDTLMPILADIGVDPGQPVISSVHNTLD